MEVSSRLRYAAPGERLFVEAKPADQGRIERIATVKGARVLDSRPIAGDLLLMTIEKD
jgi:hypothetical protein